MGYVSGRALATLKSLYPAVDHMGRFLGKEDNTFSLLRLTGSWSGSYLVRGQGRGLVQTLAPGPIGCADARPCYLLFSMIGR